MKKHANRPDRTNPEWTAADFTNARRLDEALPEVAEAMRRYRGQRGPQKAPTKELISLRLDRDVVAAFRATGSGWQGRANQALRSYVRRAGLATSARSRSGRPARTKSA